jgi:hypothetical protein
MKWYFICMAVVVTAVTGAMTAEAYFKTQQVGPRQCAALYSIAKTQPDTLIVASALPQCN